MCGVEDLQGMWGSEHPVVQVHVWDSGCPSICWGGGGGGGGGEGQWISRCMWGGGGVDLQVSMHMCR